MVTEGTHLPLSASRATRGRRRAFGQLWQVPIFLAGIGAVTGLWIARPPIHAAHSRRFDRELAAARAALDSAHPDTGRALALAQRVLDVSDQSPAIAGEAHFLIGSADVLQAKQASRDAAAEYWKEARRHLEQADELGVPTGDHFRLTFRLGVAWFQTGAAPKSVIDALSRSIELGAEKPAEGYELLTQANLLSPSPDLRAALESNRKQLALSTEDDDQIAPVRLLRGELLLRLGEDDEARKVLMRIKATAPHEVYARARFLRAQSCLTNQLWAEATGLWEEILHDTGDTPCEPGRVLFSLGLCYRRMERAKDALRLWEKAADYAGEGGQASALGLAELRLQGPNQASALDFYERALRDVATPANYTNTLMGVEEARNLVETGCRFYRQKGDFARSLTLARLYSKIGLPGSEQEMIGDTADAWAQDCLKRSRQGGNPDASRLLKEANTHFQEAAAAYAALAARLPAPADQAKWLWMSADRRLQGQDFTGAIAVLRQFLGVESAPDRLGAGWYKLAECHQALKDASAARTAFYKCIEYPGPWGFRARNELVQTDIAQGKVDDAEAALKQNLELMRGSPDEEAYEKSLRTLAALLVKRGDFRMAALRLQEMLERYPAKPETVQTRQQLADCYRRLAAQEDQNLRAPAYLTPDAQLHYRDQRRVWMQMADAHYHKISDDLAALQAARALTPGEEAIWRQVGFALAECRFEAGDYAGAVRLYEELVARYPRRAEALTALKQITRCYWVERDPKNAVETIKRVREALKDLPDSAFSDQPDGQSRQEWEEWLEWASKQ